MKEVCAVLAAGAYILSFRQFKQKGMPLNNSWLYASKREREPMDKAACYRQAYHR